MQGYAAIRKARQEAIGKCCPQCQTKIPTNAGHRRVYCSEQCKKSARGPAPKRTEYHQKYQERRRRLIAQGRWNPSKKGQGVNQ